MVEKKPLIVFLVIAFLISWPLFLLTSPGYWTIAMWGPGLAAILVTILLVRKGFKAGLKELGLGRFGKFRFYLLGWFLPPLVIALTLLLSVLLGLGKLDPNFTSLNQTLQAAGRTTVSPQQLILLQIIQGLLFGPLLNVLFTLGEEIGWRGFLLPRLLPLGQWRAILISGAIWGLWHAPAIVRGLNYPGHPILGIPMMIVFCILSAAFLSWLSLSTRSTWVAALAHGSMNAWGNLPVAFLVPGFNMLLAGTVPSLVGWIVLALFIALLVFLKQLPVSEVKEEVHPAA